VTSLSNRPVLVLEWQNDRLYKRLQYAGPASGPPSRRASYDDVTCLAVSEAANVSLPAWVGVPQAFKLSSEVTTLAI